MALYKHLLHEGFLLSKCEKHFHDDDETWIILKGKGTGYEIDHDGKRTDYMLEEGDVWMISAGNEHGSDGPNSEDFRIAVFHGTNLPGAHKPCHLYMEKEGYIPSLKLVKTPTDRYTNKHRKEEKR